MRFLNMVPTAKKKMQNYIQRHDTPAVSAPEPVSPPRPPPPPAAQLLSSPQAGRQNAVESMKLPLPATGRYARATVPEPTVQPMNASSPHYHPMRRSRGGSDQAREAMLQRDRGGQVFEDTTVRPETLPREKGHTWDGVSTGSPRVGRDLQQRWEAESTLHSLLSDSDARSVSTRHGRYQDRRFEDRAVSRSQPLERTGQRNDENAGPFIINKEGLFQVVGQPGATGTLDTSLRNSALLERSNIRGDPFRDASKEDPSPQKSRNLLRNKFPLHGDMAKRRSYADRVDPYTNNGVTRSPEPYDSAADAAKVKKEKKESDLDPKRSTLFQDVDDALTDSDCISQVPSQGDEVETQRTPKAARQLVPVQKTIMPQKSHRTVAVQKSQKPLASQKALLQESSLPRHGSIHGAGHRKRRLSADYDDSILASMRYSDLTKEDFDHDPARVAVQTANLPSGGNLEEKLVYYKDKDENNQHHFFTQMNVHEWDASGDWFLEQFGNIVHQMKESRRAKRVMVERYETEIFNREEAVRAKIDGIGRTLADLRKEGEGMMKGKEIEDD